MQQFDFTTGEKQLQLAIKSLQEAWAVVCESWDDATRERFREQYMEPLGPKVKLAIDATTQMADVVARAERACGQYDPE